MFLYFLAYSIRREKVWFGREESRRGRNFTYPLNMNPVRHAEYIIFSRVVSARDCGQTNLRVS